jgi:hypothetical protein
MSTVVFERITGYWSLAELAAMYLNGEINLNQYMEATKNPTEAPEKRENTK